MNEVLYASGSNRIKARIMVSYNRTLLGLLFVRFLNLGSKYK
ncbi:hypothetical protein bcgnr5414_64010 [Bacillus cereus]